MTMTATETAETAAPDRPKGTMTASRLVEHIKAHIEKGDQARDKSEQHYIAAGQYLATLKKEHTGNWNEWKAMLKDRVNLSTSRAGELMAIADGRKTVAETRAATAKRAAKHAKKFSVANGGKQPKPEVEAATPPEPAPAPDATGADGNGGDPAETAKARMQQFADADAKETAAEAAEERPEEVEDNAVTAEGDDANDHTETEYKTLSGHEPAQVGKLKIPDGELIVRERGGYVGIIYGDGRCLVPLARARELLEKVQQVVDAIEATSKAA